MTDQHQARITPDDFADLLRRQLLLVDAFQVTAEKLDQGFARLRLEHDERHLRPGGTICGPVMFTLADAALYAAVLATIGMLPMAVTTDMSIRFLHKPRPGDLIAEARLFKQGKRMMIGEVWIYSAGVDEPVAHVTGAYAVPRDADDA